MVKYTFNLISTSRGLGYSAASIYSAAECKDHVMRPSKWLRRHPEVKPLQRGTGRQVILQHRDAVFYAKCLGKEEVSTALRDHPLSAPPANREVNQQVWYLAKPICKAIGYATDNPARERLGPKDKGRKQDILGKWRFVINRRGVGVLMAGAPADGETLRLVWDNLHVYAIDASDVGKTTTKEPRPSVRKNPSPPRAKASSTGSSVIPCPSGWGAGPFVTVEELYQHESLQGCNPTFWADLRRAKQGPRYYQFGDKIRYRLGEVLEWVDSCAVSPVL